MKELPELLENTQRLRKNDNDREALENLEAIARVTSSEAVRDRIVLTIFQITGLILYPFMFTSMGGQVLRALRKVGIVCLYCATNQITT